ncbi:hypothetical protein NKH74_16470 [Mesorhizobium sp. M0933]
MNYQAPSLDQGRQHQEPRRAISAGEFVGLHEILDNDLRVRGYSIPQLAAPANSQRPSGSFARELGKCTSQPEDILAVNKLPDKQEFTRPLVKRRPRREKGGVGSIHSSPDEARRHPKIAQKTFALSPRYNNGIEVSTIAKPKSHWSEHKLAEISPPIGITQTYYMSSCKFYLAAKRRKSRIRPAGLHKKSWNLQTYVGPRSRL